jgi:sugar phosphate isomerase/epimerase
MQRRHFIATATSAALGAIHASPAAESSTEQGVTKILGFTKSFSELSLADTAALVEAVGWDGVDVPIRKESTHINISRAADDLPAFIEMLKKRGKNHCMVTTDVIDASAENEKFIRILAQCGIKKYRLGFHRYQNNDNPMKVAREMSARLGDIAQLNKELGIWAGYQNHSGPQYFGGPIWDVIMAMEETNPDHLGLCFDIAHATVEGGQNWPIQYRLARPRIGVAYIKDYRWREADGEWHRDACAFGTGIVRKAYFESLRKSRFHGEYCQHHEYPLGKDKERVEHYKRDLMALRKMIS